MNLAQLEHPFNEALEQYLHELPSASGNSGMDRTDYLQMIRGIILFFQNQQEPSGAITDRYIGREVAYSTPAYALGAALLVANGHPELLDSACRAMLHACRMLVEDRAPDNHSDFFTLLLVTADNLLDGLARLGPQAEWRAMLLRLNPVRVYRFQLGKVPDAQLHNRNAFNLTGEYLRSHASLGGDSGWWQRHLPFHLARFNELGLYRDGDLGGTSHSLATDAVTRLTLSALLDGGYNEEYAQELRHDLLRGALSALFIQSSSGEWPGVGCGAHHTWNDAALAAAYEWAARELKSDEPRLAAACKRGAHLALQAMRPFVRPSGELWVTRNRFDPVERHGFEEYSVQACDNLWAAAALTFAYLFADDSIPELPLPSESSSYALDLGRDFHQIVAANNGMYIQIETGGDPATNPTGLVRVNQAGANAQIGPSEGSVAEPGYSVLGPTSPLAYTPAWKDRLAGWHSLAEYGSDSSILSLRGRLSNVYFGFVENSFKVTWQGKLDGAAKVIARYVLAKDEVRVKYWVEGPLLGLRAELPVFRFDGSAASHVQASESELNVSYRDSHLRLALLTPGARLVDMQQAFATRTGLIHHWVAEAPALEIEFSIAIK